jgi:DNA mismatch repair ATPase MutS
MSLDGLIAYTGFRDFWAESTPDTPFGQDAHDKMVFFYDAAQLEAIYDQTDALLSLQVRLKEDQVRLALISRHLKDLPRLPLAHGDGSAALDEAGLFSVKKFLRNYRGLMEQLPADVRQSFGFEYRSQALEGLLNRGGQSADGFYVADEYSAGLAKVRAEILNVDTDIQSLEAERVNKIKEMYGFDFARRPFLLVPKERLTDKRGGDIAALLDVEPYDDRLYSVRPIKCAAALKLAETRQSLAQEERSQEEKVLESLSADVSAEMPCLLGYRDAALAFDLAWARARMADRLGLARPRLRTDASISIANGRFCPCEAECAKSGVPYTPLDAVFDRPATVIFGSNMGGKTIVLKTAALLQLAAQAGLFVPAECFETHIFQAFHYIGEKAVGPQGAAHGGLSGFAVEMRQLMDAWADICSDGINVLLLLDEFARTTSSGEGEAILSALLEAISNKSNTKALCSTHFHGLPEIPNVGYLRMAGLEPADAHAEAGGKDINEAIAAIARRMDYRLTPHDGRQGSDAIAIARMLGLDEGLVRRAEEYYG